MHVLIITKGTRVDEKNTSVQCEFDRNVLWMKPRAFMTVFWHLFAKEHRMIG